MNAYLTRNTSCGKSVLLNVDLYYLTQCLAHHRLSVLVVGRLNWDFHMKDRKFLATLAYSPTPSSLASQNIKDFCLFSLGFTSYQHTILPLFSCQDCMTVCLCTPPCPTPARPGVSGGTEPSASVCSSGRPTLCTTPALPCHPRPPGMSQQVFPGGP